MVYVCSPLVSFVLGSPLALCITLPIEVAVGKGCACVLKECYLLRTQTKQKIPNWVLRFSCSGKECASPIKGSNVISTAHSGRGTRGRNRWSSSHSRRYARWWAGYSCRGIYRDTSSSFPYHRNAPKCFCFASFGGRKSFYPPTTATFQKRGNRGKYIYPWHHCEHCSERSKYYRNVHTILIFSRNGTS